jgi:hypothetical protein
VQNHNQSRLGLELIRHKRKHPQPARIGPETGDFNERAIEALPQASPIDSEAINLVQLWQASQEFDIISEGHRQLLDERLLKPIKYR